MNLCRDRSGTQDTIHTVTDAELALVRFNVNIAGAFIDRFDDDFIDQFDDAGLLGHFHQVFALGAIGAESQSAVIQTASQLINGIAAQAIVFLNEALDFLFAAEDSPHFLAGQKLDIIQSVGFKGVADSDFQKTIPAPERHYAAAVNKFGWE